MGTENCTYNSLVHTGKMNKKEMDALLHDLSIKESQKRPSFNTMLDNLRRVPMGQFMRDAVKEMEQLPFVITKDNKAMAIVGPYLD